MGAGQSLGYAASQPRANRVWILILSRQRLRQVLLSRLGSKLCDSVHPTAAAYLGRQAGRIDRRCQSFSSDLNERTSEFPNTFFISLDFGAKLPYCRGGMLSTTWQGECVARCFAVVPNITSPNVSPWW